MMNSKSMRVGDIVLGLPDNGYNITCANSISRVVKVYADRTINVIAIYSPSKKWAEHKRDTHTVSRDGFRVISFKYYIEKL